MLGDFIEECSLVLSAQLQDRNDSEVHIPPLQRRDTAVKCITTSKGNYTGYMYVKTDNDEVSSPVYEFHANLTLSHVGKFLCEFVSLRSSAI